MQTHSNAFTSYEDGFCEQLWAIRECSDEGECSAYAPELDDVKKCLHCGLILKRVMLNDICDIESEKDIKWHKEWEARNESYNSKKAK